MCNISIDVWFNLIGTLASAIIGGVVAFLVCRITIKNENHNKDLERFFALCEKFEKECIPIITASTLQENGSSTKPMTDSERERIVFFFSEIENVSQTNKGCREAFYRIYKDNLREAFLNNVIPQILCLELGKVFDKKTKTEQPSITKMDKTTTPESDIYKKAQNLALGFSKFLKKMEQS